MSHDNPYSSPRETNPNSPLPDDRSIRIKRLGVASCAKMLGLFYAAFGLVFGAVVSLLVLLGASEDLGQSAGGVLVGGALAIIVMPACYGAAGALVGAIIATTYNVVAAAAGGIEIEIG